MKRKTTWAVGPQVSGPLECQGQVNCATRVDRNMLVCGFMPTIPGITLDSQHDANYLFTRKKQRERERKKEILKKERRKEGKKKSKPKKRQTKSCLSNYSRLYR